MEVIHLMEDISIKTGTLDGKHIGYHSGTEFMIQLGKNRSAYHTVRVIVGDLGRAVMHYNALNIGYGYKKRLIVPAFNKPILARQFS